ncbi:patatin-like phospholipase family protein [Cellulosilyticum sp. I15G10I2]|uniref:patatin-like phospholipase family protein n=1 Tax=Cellulosilyticum sp. I15G10I2 TaxID=1892843 RepID=UPI00085C4483|nr:patatin-like phospholipase family protein [Cellulosilyticum sp. I15G10I2]
MKRQFKNLVFEGGGVWGIAYIGMLDYLYHHGILDNITRVAGTSAGAISACITSFNLPFNEMKTMADSLDYQKVPGKGELLGPKIMPRALKRSLNKLFGDIDCVYRLIKQYGWYSSDYFYRWVKQQIASQFDADKKLPPYTFTDFKNPFLHKDNRHFRDLCVIGTDISNHVTRVFCYENTPHMEVAEAVRISMSIPLFFEAIESPSIERSSDSHSNLFSDGGVMYSYPINLFDKEDPPAVTLGGMFKSELPPQPINNLVDFISNVLACSSKVQEQLYLSSPEDLSRSIQINTKEVSAVNFNILTEDLTYKFLYYQGYSAAQEFFEGTIDPDLPL